MKRTFLFLAIMIILFCSCKKDHGTDKAVLINCNGLVTDTTGTNDTARIYMPNAFSPNADGINDISRPIFKGVASFDFTIYDENNAIVFTSDQVFHGYSPTTAPTTFIKYYYKIQVVTLQGHHIGECGDLYCISCLPPGIAVSSLYLEDELMLAGFYHTPSIDPATMHSCP